MPTVDCGKQSVHCPFYILRRSRLILLVRPQEVSSQARCALSPSLLQLLPPLPEHQPQPIQHLLLPPPLVHSVWFVPSTSSNNAALPSTILVSSHPPALGTCNSSYTPAPAASSAFLTRQLRLPPVLFVRSSVERGSICVVECCIAYRIPLLV
ncbi:hypothetical protein BC830DRAFT_1150265 [Chytriomyces sp. MP71]|nr:hypothetical protein BC830DRAFT_1150265 [Chytriomyces sp. MP71]